MKPLPATGRALLDPTPVQLKCLRKHVAAGGILPMSALRSVRNDVFEEMVNAGWLQGHFPIVQSRGGGVQSEITDAGRAALARTDGKDRK